MRTLLPRFLGLTLIGLALLTATGCSRKDRALSMADSYYAAGDYTKAEIEYRNVLQSDPVNARASSQLGLIYADQGRNRDGYAYLNKARQLAPENLAVRAKLALYFLALKNTAEARTEAQYILEREPAHPEAPVLYAESAQQPGEFDPAREYLKKLSTAGTAPVLTALANLDFRQKKVDEAEALLHRALALDPNSATTHAFLGTIALTRKNLPAAETAFAAAWKLSAPRSANKLYYVRFKLQSGDVAAARNLLTELVAQAPDCLPPLILLTEVAVREKKTDEALALADKILTRDPLNLPTLLLQARLKLAKGETDAALTELGRLRELQPKNPEVPYQIALAHIAKQEPAKAITSLNQTLDLAPQFADAILLLTELNLKKGDTAAASTALKPLLAHRPDLIPAKFLQARIHVSKGELAEALTIYQEVAAASPNDANLLLPLAQIYRHQKNFTAARQVLSRALALAPDSVPVNEHLIDLDLLQRDFPAARQRVATLATKLPGNAGVHLLLAKIALAEKNLAEAEAELIKVVDLQPDTPGAYYLLADIYSQTQQEKKAVTQLEQLLPKNPKSIGLHMRIALLNEQLKDYAGARTAYEAALALQPKLTTALNNLGYLYAERLNEVDRGFTFAQKARDLSPLDPNIADTLGWILFKQGQYQQARILLLESAAKMPDNAIVQYHIGMAHYMMGSTEAAQAALLRALQLDPALTEKPQIEKRLAILDTESRGTPAAQRAALEQYLQENRTDPVALTKLGVLLSQAGDPAQAKKRLQDALAINPLNVNTALALTRVYLELKETKPAMDLAKATRTQAPDDPAVSHQLGRIAFQSGDYQWAASLLQESARKLPDDAEVLRAYAKAAYSIGRVDDAQEIMQRLAKTPSLTPASSEIASYLEMAALERSPSAEGAGKIQQALSADPSFVPALMARAAWAEKQADLPAAQQALEQVLARYPDFLPAKKKLVILAAASGPGGPKAYELATQVREALPTDAEVAGALGILAYHKGDFNRAAALLRESSGRLGEDARRTFFLGMAQHRLKDKAAKATLQRALALGLGEPQAGEVRQTLTELP